MSDEANEEPAKELENEENKNNSFEEPAKKEEKVVKIGDKPEVKNEAQPGVNIDDEPEKAENTLRSPKPRRKGGKKRSDKKDNLNDPANNFEKTTNRPDHKTSSGSSNSEAELTPVPFKVRLKVLITKNFLLMTSNVRLFVFQIVWPIIVFAVLLIAIHLAMDDVDNIIRPNCFVRPKALPSAGLMPFLFSFMCARQNLCDMQPKEPFGTDAPFAEIWKLFTQVVVKEGQVGVTSPAAIFSLIVFIHLQNRVVNVIR